MAMPWSSVRTDILVGFFLFFVFGLFFFCIEIYLEIVFEGALNLLMFTFVRSSKFSCWFLFLPFFFFFLLLIVIFGGFFRINYGKFLKVNRSVYAWFPNDQRVIPLMPRVIPLMRCWSDFQSNTLTHASVKWMNLDCVVPVYQLSPWQTHSRWEMTLWYKKHHCDCMWLKLKPSTSSSVVCDANIASTTICK